MILGNLHIENNSKFDGKINVDSVLIYSGTPQSITGNGVINLTTSITHLITSQTGDALSLADGEEGQLKTITMITLSNGGDTSVITPANFTNGTTLTIDDIGKSVTLLFTNGSWQWYGGYLAVIA